MKNLFSIEPDGSVNYMGEDGKTSTLVNSENSERLFNEIKQHNTIRNILKEASDDLQKALKDGDEEAKEDAIRRLNLAEQRKNEVEQEFNQIKSKVNETAQLSKQLDNGLLTPIASFFEVYLRTRERLLALLPNSTMDVFKKNFIDSANNNQDEQVKLLESSGLQHCTDLSNDNPGFMVEKKEQDVLIVTFFDENGKSGCIVIDKPEQLELLKTKNSVTDKLSKCIEVDFFTVPYSVYQDNSLLLSVAENKKDYVEKLQGSVKHKTFSVNTKARQIEAQSATKVQGEEIKEHDKKETIKQKIEVIRKVNKEISTSMKSFAKKGGIDPRKVDWSEFIAKGINVEKLSNEDKANLLSGKKTSLIESIRQEADGRISSTPCKVLLREKEGRYYPIILAKMKNLSLPEEFFGHKFSDKEINELQTKGMLSETIQVKIASSTVNVMPFVDKDLNSLMFRNYDKLKLPDEIGNIKLSSEAKSDLLNGRIATLQYVTGETGETYPFSVRINPVTAHLETIKSTSIGLDKSNSTSTAIDLTSEKTEAKKTVLKTARKIFKM